MLHILAGNAGEDIDLVLDAAKNGNPLDWIVPRKAKPNDPALFYLPGRGFTARGIVDSVPKRASPGEYRADVREITLLSSAVPVAFIRENHPDWQWPNSYSKSRATIDGAIETRLEELLASYQASFAEPLTEGASRSVSVTVYERNPLARQQCIAHYGPTCFACGFNFGEVYGETAEGFIHVHHLKAVAGAGQRKVNPVKDLRPICPNCHAVIHLQHPPLSITELKLMLKQVRSAVKL